MSTAAKLLAFEKANPFCVVLTKGNSAEIIMSYKTEKQAIKGASNFGGVAMSRACANDLINAFKK